MKYFYFLLISIAVISCAKEDTVIANVNESVVVLAYLYADTPVDSIRVTKTIPYTNEGALEVVDDLSITLSTEDEDIILESIGNGYYRNLSHIIQQEMAYSLYFEYNGKTISSQTYIKSSVEVSLSRSEIEIDKVEIQTGGPGGGGGPGEQMDDEVVDIFWQNENNDYYFVVIENIEDEPEYVNEFFQNLENDEDRPQRIFRTEPEIMDTYSINSRRELQTYGTYEIIVYRLNTEYAALYNSVGSSTLSIEEPPSNITNGLGIFTGVTAHKLLLEVNEP